MIVAADETGRVLDVEPLNYVRKIDGVWAPCKPECAQAICKYNQLYSIDPDNPVPLHDDNDGEPTEGETTAPPMGKDRRTDTGIHQAERVLPKRIFAFQSI